ncbi:FAD-dependent oxidoreductase [Novosphingobium sp. 9]|uniref:FAD-dependent oxidoreductase n=1 Tax=Novosphingobium sp. 9 TaxID=2025349 RepID=UPI0021B521C7|nr:FAD-dependent oxidoreductase [Novosphingobium sp. 9]
MTMPDFEHGIDASDLTETQPLAGTWRGQDVVLVRHGGKVCALAGKCTHLQAPLAKGIVTDGQIRCPFHHARFDLETGEAVAAPAFLPLTRFEVAQDNGRILVTGEAAATQAPARAAPAFSKRVVIIGGGAAGHACAEMLGRHGAGDYVTVLSADDHLPYDRTSCSKAFLAGAADRDTIDLPLETRSGLPCPTVRTQVAVARIEPQAKLVETGKGQTIPYDVLVLATGATPISPDFPGSDRTDVHQLRTLDDAEALITASMDAKSAVILGSSYIGLEVAASLVQRGLQVHVVSTDDIPLEKTAGPELGKVLQDLHESKGVRFHLNREIREWNGTRALLDNGESVTGDFLVLGTGVSPRVELAQAAGLTLAPDEIGGIAVNGRLQTSVPDIYAIGDIAAFPDPRLGHAIRVEHWALAQRMGQWLARHLLGEVEGEFDALPFFWSGQYDLNLRYIGHVDSPEDRKVDGDPAERDVAIVMRENGDDQALVTCGRDRQSLEVEAAWEGR